jgi:hypothetical protein
LTASPGKRGAIGRTVEPTAAAGSSSRGNWFPDPNARQSSTAPNDDAVPAFRARAPARSVARFAFARDDVQAYARPPSRSCLVLALRAFSGRRSRRSVLVRSEHESHGARCARVASEVEATSATTIAGPRTPNCQGPRGLDSWMLELLAAS